MNSTEYVVATVDGFRVPDEGPDAVLRMHDSGDYQIAKDDPRFEVWSRMIKDYRAAAKPLYVEFNPATRAVKEIFQPVIHRIRHVAQEQKDDRVDVVLLMAPSMYHLKTKRANYEKMLRLLEESVRSATPVLVTAHPDTQEILDVRPK